MRITDWFKNIGRRRDEEARQRAAAEAVETKAERAATAGGIEGVQADEGAARSMAEASMKDVDRLGE